MTDTNQTLSSAEFGETAPPEGRRCLILANLKAGGLSTMERFTRLQKRFERPLESAAPATTEVLSSILTTLALEAADIGLEADVEPIPAPEQLPALLRAAETEGYDTIVAAGGDGTVRTVAQLLVGSRLRLGILPVGTANNTAHALGIPFAIPDALRVIANGFERRIDVGRIGDEYFLEAAGVGLFADALYAYGASEPHRHNVVSLIRLCTPLLWHPHLRSLQLTLDGVVEQEQVVLVSVSNAAYLGEGWAIAPDAQLCDGKFDVIIVGATSRWELMQFMAAAMFGKHLALPKVRRVQARTVEIQRVHRSLQPVPVHVDDHIAAYTPVRLEAVPQALRVLAPRPPQ